MHLQTLTSISLILIVCIIYLAYMLKHKIPPFFSSQEYKNLPDRLKILKDDENPFLAVVPEWQNKDVERSENKDVKHSELA